MLKIQVIIGSTRKNRFSEKPAQWVFEELKKQKDVEVELVDLRDYPLPFYEEPSTPTLLKSEYSDPAVMKWLNKVKEGDGYLIITPEYNHGYSAVLKNALDYVFYEWHKKPVAFLSYGSALGARAVEQLRQVAVELQMAPIRNAIHLPVAVLHAARESSMPVPPEVFEPIQEKADATIEELIWWAKTLKTGRET